MAGTTAATELEAQGAIVDVVDFLGGLCVWLFLELSDNYPSTNLLRFKHVYH